MTATASPSLETFLITGAGGGIGGAVARRLAGRGGNLRLALHGRTAEKLRAAAQGCGEGSVALERAGDLTGPREAEETVAAATAAFGGNAPDCVVHCAGVGLIKPTLETADAEFTRIMNVNVRATFLLARECCRVWTAAKRRGLFITLPGILGKAPMRNAATYAASKYAVTGMLKSMALEFQRGGVRFTLLHLGGVDTGFWDGISMAVQRDKMIPAETAADCVLAAIDAPAHLVLTEMTLQPESHQM